MTILDISRGFGFVTFKEEAAKNEVLDVEDHIILGKKTDCKMAMTKEQAFQKQKEQIKQNRKLFVNNIPPGLKRRDLRKFFNQFGKVIEVNLIYKKRDKGFAFVVYEDEHQAGSVLEQQEELKIGENIVREAS